MSKEVTYSVVARKNMLKKDDPAKYYAQAQASGDVGLDEISTRVEKACTVHSADVVAVLKALEDEMVDGLSRGEIVRLGNIGTFQQDNVDVDHSDVIMQRDEYRYRHSRLLLGDPVLDIGSKRRNTSYAFNFLGCICGDRSQDIFGNSQTADRLLDLMVHIIRPPVSQFCGNPHRTVLWIDSISHLCVQVPNLPFCAHNF